MREGVKGFQVYLYNCRLKLYTSIQYKADFIFGMIMTFLNALLGPLVQYFIITNTRGFPGWTLDEIMLFQGVVLLFLGVKNLLFGDIREIAMQIARKGDFDRYLLKPYFAIVNIWGNSFQFGSFPTIVCGILVIIWFSVSLKLQYTLGMVVQLFLCLLFAMIFCGAMVTFLCGIVIMFIRIGRIWETFDVLLRFSNYPLNIYPRKLEWLFSTFLPLGLMALFPVQVLLGKIRKIMLLAFAGAILLLVLSLLFWRFCIKRYTSAGG
mgnify:CR=1 FL=1